MGGCFGSKLHQYTHRKQIYNGKKVRINLLLTYFSFSWTRWPQLSDLT